MADLDRQDDNLLMQKLIAGDVRAFRQLYDLYQPQVMRFALYLTKSPDLAQEIVQEVFLRVWEKREMFTVDVKVLPYIKKIAQNLVLDTFRKAHRDKKLFQKLFDQMNNKLAAPVDQLQAKELNAIYYRAIQKLPPQQKAVYSLSRSEALSYHEIAQKLGLSSNTVRNHMAEALRFLRTHVRNHAELPLLIALIVENII